MASFIKRNGAWRASIFRKGIRKTATFDTKEEAHVWAYQIENDILNDKFIDDALYTEHKEQISLIDIFNKYSKEISINKRGALNELARLEFFKKEKLFDLPIQTITPRVIAKWRDQRLKFVKESTVNRDLNLLSSVFSIAIKEWGIELLNNPVHMIQRPKNPRSRSRRISDDEQQKIAEILKWNMKYSPKTMKQWVAFAMFLSLYTAMRRGELLSIQWKNIHLEEAYIHLDVTKNGEARDVPLSSDAKKLLNLVKKKKDKDFLFPISGDYLTKTFIKAVRKANLKDLHFHDIRREATTRLSKKLSNVLELSAVTGHKDLQTLKKYYQPKATELAKKLD